MKAHIAAGAAVIALSALIVPLNAANGVTLVMKTTRHGTTQTQQIQLTSDRIHAELADTDGERQSIVFDGPRQALDVIKPAEKSYTEMTKADVDRIGAQVSAAMQQMQDRLANLPPEQRAKIEAMMKGRSSMAQMVAGVKPEYKKVGTDRVGKWACDKYEGYRNGKPETELCTVAPAALGLSESDFAVGKQLASFLGKLMPPQASELFTFGGTNSQGFSGIPVRRVDHFGGTESVTELTDVVRGSIPDSAFQIPAGFEKKPLPMLQGRGRQ
jgi:hypothetical protein